MDFKTKSYTEGRWTIYEHSFTTEDVSLVREVIDWCDALPPQGQYEAVLELHAYSDAPPHTTYSIRTKLYGDELSLDFKLRFQR